MRSLGEAARAHDDSIRVATAAVMAQYEPKPADLKLQAVGEGFLHQVPDSGIIQDPHKSSRYLNY